MFGQHYIGDDGKVCEEWAEIEKHLIAISSQRCAVARVVGNRAFPSSFFVPN
eukprot:c45178_g1_i1 orf=112-267(+)